MELLSCSFISNTLWLLSFYLIFSIARGIHKYCLRKGRNLKERYSQPRKDTYACVTGATSGIGKGFAFQLAQRGFNILLVSRSEAKLKAVKQELLSLYPEVKIEYVVADFGSNQSLDFYENVCAKINNYDIGLLVNNAGVMQVGNFCSVESTTHLQVMEVNMLPYAMLTRFILPAMNKRDARSGIIIVSSIVIYMSCTPVNAIYRATKQFDDSFAKGLAYEVENKIDVLCVKPAFVESNMSKKKKGLEAISAEDCVVSVLRQMGTEKSSTGHWSQEVQAFLLEVVEHLPTMIKQPFFRFLGNQLNAHIQKHS